MFDTGTSFKQILGFGILIEVRCVSLNFSDRQKYKEQINTKLEFVSCLFQNHMWPFGIQFFTQIDKLFLHTLDNFQKPYLT